MSEAFLSIFSVYIMISVFAFEKWYKYSCEKKLWELVSWSAIGDYNPVLDNYSYIEEILIAALNAQYDDTVEKKYRISGDEEKRYLKEIIEEYQKEIMRTYFEGRLHLIKSKYAISKKDYFMIKLHDFLVHHQDDFRFLGRDMHDAAGMLSEIAIVYNKLLYITHMYCKRSPITNPNGSQHWMDWEERNIKEILDSGLIQRT